MAIFLTSNNQKIIVPSQVAGGTSRVKNYKSPNGSHSLVNLSVINIKISPTQFNFLF